VTQLPVTRCQICRRTVAYRPGNLSEILTKHSRRAHAEALGILPGSRLLRSPPLGHLLARHVLSLVVRETAAV